LVFNGGAPVDVTAPGFSYVGSTGDDEQLGTQAGDTLDGGQGGDLLDGGDGNDTLLGGEGGDELIGVDGDDSVDGGEGNDTIEGGSGEGNDTYVGGDGVDVVTYTSTSMGIVVDLTAGTATGVEIGDDELYNIENVIGGDGPDSITGNGDANVLSGVAGQDTLSGLAHNDSLYGGSGQDVLQGGDGNDLLSGDSDNDILQGGAGNDSLDGGAEELTGGDTAKFTGERYDYLITETDGTYTIRDLRDGAPEGIDTAVDVELFDFDGTLIAAADLIGEPPTDIALTPSSVVENSGAGTVVGTLSAIDPTAGGDMHTFAIVGGSDQFEIVGAEIRVKTGAIIDYENEGSHSIQIVAIDGLGATYIESITIDVTNANDAPTGIVSIAGTATEDQTLTASNTLDDQDGLGTVGYQWLRDGNAIGGANNATYTLGDDDVGTSISVRASYADTFGTTSVDSAGTGPIANVNDNPVNTVPGAQTATAGVAKAIGGVSITDVDSPNVTTTLTAAGQLSASNAGGAVVTGSGTGTLSIAGTQAEVNAALGTLSYLKATAGADVIMMATNDGAGGVDVDPIAVTVAAAGSGNTIVGTAAGDKIYGSLTVAGQPKVTAFGDTIIGNDGADTIDGGAGADSIDGGEGADSMRGGDGNDTILGGGGDDKIHGHAGDDSLDGGTGQDIVYGLAGSDTLVGGDGQDLLNGGTEADDLSGGTDLDTLRGGDGNDTLDGGSDNDSLDGGANDDVLMGGEGADKLVAGAGNDTLTGGAGTDTLIGGLGQDVFVFDLAGFGAGIDRVSDFKVADGDLIRLDSAAFSAAQADMMGVLLASNFVVGSAATTADHHIVYNFATGALLYDADGVGGAAATQFATLSPRLGIAYDDFVLMGSMV
jgi:Ca2+-binding RTX toxin-like protein